MIRARAGGGILDFAEFEQLVATQRAVRKFDGRAVDDATIEKVLKAATRAPSARNVQPWRFIVIRDPGTKGNSGRSSTNWGSNSMGPGRRTGSRGRKYRC